MQVDGATLIFTIGVVVIACLGIACSICWASRTKNLFWLGFSMGLILLVAGIIWQRTPVANSSGVDQSQGAWDAVLKLPLLGLQVDLVAVVGLLVTGISVVLLLFFERVGDENTLLLPTLHPLDDDDAV